MSELVPLADEFMREKGYENITNENLFLCGQIKKHQKTF